MSLKEKIPWWFKIIIKSILSRIPKRFSFWRKYIFIHGDMLKPDYALKIFIGHYDKAAVSLKGENIVALELGPGDSLYSAMIAKAFKFSHTYLVDVACFASSRMEPYLYMGNYLENNGFHIPQISNISSTDELLKLYDASYLTSGISSLRTIPDQSIDYIWSEAVLEHIRLSEFINTFLEIKRILKPDGICSHRIDLRDHLAKSINSLRFSEKLWESDFMAKSGFYTNRIRYSQMINIFEQIGFSVVPTIIERWEKLPVSKSKLATEFRHLSDEDLCISVFDVLLKLK